MSMRAHILAALQEQLSAWEAQISSLNSEQLSKPLSPSPWTVKDVLAHLWAWQQRSIARLVAAHSGKVPEFPQWLAGEDPDGDNPERINAWLYETYHALPWTEVYTKWREGYRRLLDLGGMISERDLLDSSFYSWMSGYPLVNVLISSYDHHQEHLEKLQAWLKEHGV